MFCSGLYKFKTIYVVHRNLCVGCWFRTLIIGCIVFLSADVVEWFFLNTCWKFCLGRCG